MRISWLSFSLAFAGLGSGCDKGDDPPPSVMEQPPATAAELSTEVVCDYTARCGLISVYCADCDGEDSECVGCFVETTPVTHAACEADVLEDFETGFACETLTAEEEVQIDACLAALPDHACPSVEAVEAWANGGGGDDPREPPAGCDVLEDVRYRCLSYDDGDDGMSPTPIPE